jgi:hypothetical protein
MQEKTIKYMYLIFVPNERFENETQSKDFGEALTNYYLIQEA